MYKEPGVQPLEGILLHQPFYTEGPAVDPAGNLFVTNLQGGQILLVGPQGETREWARSSCPNGQLITADGVHWICDSLEACVKRFDPSGNLVGVAAEGAIGADRIRCPNDLVSDGDGGFFFTDSVRHSGFVAHVDRFGTKKIIARELDYPNGLVLNHTSGQLFIAESYRNRILVLDLKQPGMPLRVFCDLPRHASMQPGANLPDGMALDLFGSLWVAHYGMSCIWVIDALGQKIRKWDTGILLTSNIFITNGLLLVTGGVGEPGPGLIRLVKTTAHADERDQ